MDTTKLAVGQNVFMVSGPYGDWCRVVEVTPNGVIVQSDPCYGTQLIRFDKNGTSCDSSDIDIQKYKDAIISRYLNERVVPTSDDDMRLFWEHIERTKTLGLYNGVPGTERGPWKLYPNPGVAFDDRDSQGNLRG